MLDFSRFLPDPSSWTVRGVACAAGLLALTSAGFYTYRRLKRRSDLPAAELQPADGRVAAAVEEPEAVQVTESHFQLLPSEHDPETSAAILVTETSFRLLPTEEDPQTSADVLFSQLSATRDLHSAWHDVQFLFSESYSFLSETVEVRRYFLCAVRGPEVQLWFFTTTKMSCDHLVFSNCSRCEDTFTAIQRVSGSVRELVSCHRAETIVHVPREDCVLTFHQVSRSFLHVDVDDRVDTCHQEEETRFTFPHADSDIRSESEESDLDLSPEQREVPFISCHLADSGVADVALKLPAVREAFSRMSASLQNQSFLYEAGKMILIHLAAANKQDVVGVQLAYDAVILFLIKPANQELIRAELVEAQLHHFSFLDVFFELIVFGCFINGSPPAASDGGFLQRLLATISMWDVDIREPEAEQLCLVLSDKLTALLEELFSQPLELYSDPAALTTTVLHLMMEMMEHIQDLLTAMEGV